MNPKRFVTLARAISAVLPRRRLAGALGLSAAGLSSLVEARKKRKRRKKRKKKCGKPGRKPVKGKCCKKSVRVDGRCQRCDVCASGCAFASVQAAIDATDNGDSIALCPGTYGGDLRIAKDLTLVGAGDSAGPGNTILEGAGAGTVVLIAEGSTVTLQHLRVTGGNGGNGGGIYNAGGRAELIGCTVSGNAASRGGGIYNIGGTLLIASAVSENTSGGNGGGIYNDGGTVELIDCTVSRNTGAADSAGGGILNGDGTLTLQNSTVSENEAGNSGGGVYNGGALNLIASEIRGNRAGDGGGLFNRTTVTADAASRIRANTAANQGGGIYSSLLGTTTLASSAIVTGNSPNNCAGLAAVPNCIG